MTGVIVLEQLIGTLSTSIKNICHPTIILGEPVIDKFYKPKYRALWFFAFLFAACGLFLVSLNLSGITSSGLLSAICLGVGVLLVFLAAVFYSFCYCQSLRKKC
jgi:hypothetical protein